MTIQSEPARFDVGLRILPLRTGEDSASIEDPRSTRAHHFGLVAVVADGVGGLSAGEEASRLAVQTFMERYYSAASEQDVRTRMLSALKDANAAVFGKGLADESCEGLGTTLTAAVIFNGMAHFVSIGDSRAYLTRDGRAALTVSEDHTLVAEALRSGAALADVRKETKRHVITRYLGMDEELDLDESGSRGRVYSSVPIREGDTVVLCTDGLFDVVPGRDIGRLAAMYPPREAADRLAELARRRKSRDDVTVVVVHVGEFRPMGATARLRGLLSDVATSRSAALVGLVGVLLLATAAVYAMSSPMRSDSDEATLTPTSVNAQAYPTATAVAALPVPTREISISTPVPTHTPIATPTLTPTPAATPTRTATVTPPPTPTWAPTATPEPFERCTKSIRPCKGQGPAITVDCDYSESCY